MVKYEITDIAHPDNSSLHRIKALIDIPRYDIKAGDLGGYATCRMKNGRPPVPDYCVVNKDEPYAKEILAVIKRGEEAKEARK